MRVAAETSSSSASVGLQRPGEQVALRAGRMPSRAAGRAAPRVSTPSATISRSRRRPRSMIAADDRAASPASRRCGATNERSILSDVDGELRAGSSARSSRCRSRRGRAARRARAARAATAPAPLGSADERGLGDLEDSAAGGQPARGQRRGHVAEQVRRAAAARAETLTAIVSVGRAGCSRARPAAVRQASRSTQRPIGHDQAGLLGDRDEPVGRARRRARASASAAAPRSPTTAPVGQVDDRLVDAAGTGRRLERAAQLRSSCAGARRAAARMPGSKTTERAAAGGLRARTWRRRRRGAATSPVGPVVGQRDARCSPLTVTSLAGERRPGRQSDREQPLARWPRPRRRRPSCLEQDGELVAAEPGHGVAGADGAAQPAGDARAAARRRPGGRGCR